MKYILKWIAIVAILGGNMNAQDNEQVKIDSVEINNVSVPLLFESSKNLPVGDVQLIFVGGSADAHIPGLGAMSANLLNEGTKELGNVAFANRLESKAIGLYASVGLQTLSFDLSFLKEFSDESFSLLSMLLYDPNLTPKAFSKVKSLILNKIARNKDNFDDVAEKNLKSILFKGTPMAIPVLGDEESIESITLEDIKAFLGRNLVLKRLIIVAGGDLQKEELKKQLIATLSKLPVGEGKERLHFSASKEVDSIIVKKPTQQAFIYFGAPFDVVDKEKNYIAKVMSFILGGSGFGSRMIEEVRVKRGLAYSASKDEAIKVVKEVVNDFIAKGATQTELDAAKAFLLGSEPLREETLSQRLGAKFSNYFRGLSLDNHKRELALIKDLSLEELNAYITSHKEILQMSFSIVDAE